MIDETPLQRVSRRSSTGVANLPSYRVLALLIDRHPCTTISTIHEAFSRSSPPLIHLASFFASSSSRYTDWCLYLDHTPFIMSFLLLAMTVAPAYFTIVQGHMAVWHPSVYGFDQPYEPVTPLANKPFGDWVGSSTPLPEYSLFRQLTILCVLVVPRQRQRQSFRTHVSGPGKRSHRRTCLSQSS